MLFLLFFSLCLAALSTADQCYAPPMVYGTTCTSQQGLVGSSGTRLVFDIGFAYITARPVAYVADLAAVAGGALEARPLYRLRRIPCRLARAAYDEEN